MWASTIMRWNHVQEKRIFGDLPLVFFRKCTRITGGKSFKGLKVQVRLLAEKLSDQPESHSDKDKEVLLGITSQR